MFNQVVDIATHSGGYVAAGVADTVIGDAVLREVVGADFFGAIARADKGAALTAQFGIFFVNFHLEEATAEYAHGFELVFELGFFVLIRHDETRRDVRDPDGAIGGVDALASVATGAVDVDAKIARVYLDVGLLSLGQYGDSDGTGVDTALAFGDGHALDAVHA